jgi:hypothetical protein
MRCFYFGISKLNRDPLDLIETDFVTFVWSYRLVVVLVRRHRLSILQSSAVVETTKIPVARKV